VWIWIRVRQQFQLVGETETGSLGVYPVEIQFDLDPEKFCRMAMSLMSAATPPPG
jgi:hypothetical protein